MTTLGSNIKRLRESKELSQFELANFIGVSQSAVGNWEAGIRTEIRGTILVKLAGALGVEPRQLIENETETAPAQDKNELKVLAAYRSLTENQRELALRLVRAINK